MKLLGSLILFFLPLLSHSAKPWSHIEYGAANYGPRPGSRLDKQYKILFETLDEIIAKRGPQGVFYVNDLPENTKYVADRLRAYAKSKGYAGVEIIEVPGDFRIMPKIPPTETAHLKHPAPKMLDDVNYRFSEVLRRLSDASEEGLEFTTFLDLEESPLNSARMQKLGPGKDYYLPDGRILEANRAKRYHVSTKDDVAKACPIQIKKLLEEVKSLRFKIETSSQATH